MIEAVSFVWFLIIITGIARLLNDDDENCPHCGYYCHGKSAFCTKHPDVKNKVLEE